MPSTLWRMCCAGVPSVPRYARPALRPSALRPSAPQLPATLPAMELTNAASGVQLHSQAERRDDVHHAAGRHVGQRLRDEPTGRHERSGVQHAAAQRRAQPAPPAEAPRRTPSPSSAARTAQAAANRRREQAHVSTVEQHLAAAMISMGSSRRATFSNIVSAICAAPATGLNAANTPIFRRLENIFCRYDVRHRQREHNAHVHARRWTPRSPR